MIENLNHTEAVRHNLANVQNAIDQISDRDIRTDLARTHLALAQTHALTAIVAAIDGVTSEIAQLRKAITEQGPAGGAPHG